MNNKNDIVVAQILDPEKIVINKGSKDQIDQNMEFVVYEEAGEVVDPVTKKNLGLLENPKGTFRPLHIQDNMSTLISQAKRPSHLLSITTFMSGPDPEFELLKTIKVGDKVKIINRI